MWYKLYFGEADVDKLIKHQNTLCDAGYQVMLITGQTLGSVRTHHALAVSTDYKHAEIMLPLTVPCVSIADWNDFGELMNSGAYW